MTSKRDLMRNLKDSFEADAHRETDRAEQAANVGQPDTAARHEGSAEAYADAAFRLGEALAGKAAG